MAQRTNSSTATGSRASRSSSSSARWSGLQVSARIACEVVWRRGVVAGHRQQHEEGRDLGVGELARRRSRPGRARSSGRRAGCCSRSAAISVANCESVQIASPSTSPADRGPSRNCSSPTETIVSAALTTRSRSASGTPIMSEIVWSGSRLAISDTKSPPPVGAGLRHDLLGRRPDAVLDPRHLARREGRRDEPAQLGVARRVHREEGLRGLEQLRRRVADTTPSAGAEGLRVARDPLDVVVADDRPVARGSSSPIRPARPRSAASARSAPRGEAARRPARCSASGSSQKATLLRLMPAGSVRSIDMR